MPIAGDDGRLPIIQTSVAEISRAAGFHPAAGATDTERDVEIRHEANMLIHDLVVYQTRRLAFHEGGLDFAVGASRTLALESAPENIEDHAFEHRSTTTQLTKMALARQLQLRDGLSDDRRDLIWQTLDKDVLIAALMDPSVVLAAAKGRGRGGGGGGGGGGRGGGGGGGGGGGRGGGPAAGVAGVALGRGAGGKGKAPAPARGRGAAARGRRGRGRG